MENIKLYNKYKPSGIAWLGDIPEHWDILDTKRCFNFPKNNVGEDYVKFKVLSLSIRGVIFRNIESGMGKYHSDMGTYQIVNPDSIILCLFDMDVTPRIVGYSDKTGIITSAYVNITPKENVSSKYFYYYYLLQDFNNYLFSQGTGIRTTLTRSQFGSLKISLPTFKEQTVIANFLDYKTAKIDRFIREKKQLIKLLNEQKAGIINHAVTKGLNPNTTMKDSGIEWLGNIPEHWEIVKLTGVCGFARGNSSFKKDELLSNGKYVALQYGKTYKVNEVDEKYQFYVNDEFYKVSQIVNYGDVIFISTSETIEDLGHSVFYNRSDLGLLGGEQILLKPKNDIVNGRYLCYSSKIFAKELKKYATGVKVFRFNINDLKTIYTSVPPIQEQTAIVSHIEKETTIINKTITTIEKEIALTQEYRTALIAEAVTGKIDVRAFVIPTVSPQEELYEEIEEELDMVAEDAESYENE